MGTPGQQLRGISDVCQGVATLILVCSIPVLLSRMALTIYS